MWTEQEIKLAKELTTPEILSFLQKVFVDIHTSNGDVLEKNIVALDDSEYGRLMKVLYLTRKENTAKINLLKKIANTKVGGTQTPKAPK